MGIRRLRVQEDSKVIIKQVNEEFTLKELLLCLRELFSEVDHIFVKVFDLSMCRKYTTLILLH